MWNIIYHKIMSLMCITILLMGDLTFYAVHALISLELVLAPL